MQRIVRAVCDVVWGPPMLLLLIGCGVYYTQKLNFLQISRAREWCKETFGSLFARKKCDGISPYRAVSSALASSIGTGSIIGVATAITAGGAGAVFWMWLSAFFGMATKYAEVVLAVSFREKRDGGYCGGPMYYIEKGLGKSMRPLAMAFSVCGALACLGMGAMNQSNSIASVVGNGFGINPYFCGLVLALIAALAVSGGIARVSRFAEMLVPLMAVLYLLGGICIVLIAPGKAAGALIEIFRCALTPRAVYGAAAGEAFRAAVRFGVARGVFSNEAGLGSSPIVHAAANTKSPAAQGYWGMFEVFVDTMVVCTVTAIAVISSGVHHGNAEGAILVTNAFSTFFGDFGGVFVGAATVMFSLTTILGWSYYGERCVAYLTNEKKSARYFYRALFVVAVFVGAGMNVKSVWELSDMFNGLMMVPNLIALFLLSPVVVKESINLYKR